MNRRNFIRGAGLFGLFSILPAAKTYERIWKPDVSIWYPSTKKFFGQYHGCGFKDLGGGNFEMSLFEGVNGTPNIKLFYNNNLTHVEIAGKIQTFKYDIDIPRVANMCSFPIVIFPKGNKT